MSIAYLCVLIAAILPYVFVGYAKFSTKGYDNNNPREFLERQEGRAKRAHWAHCNSFEAFPAFAAGVIIAHLAAVPQGAITALAVSFVGLRIIYGVLYILDKPSLRSLVWFLAFGCVLSLFVLSVLR